MAVQAAIKIPPFGSLGRTLEATRDMFNRVMPREQAPISIPKKTTL